MIKNINLKQIGISAGIIAVFVIIATVFFFPAVEGKLIYSSDYVHATSAAKAPNNYREATGDISFWTDGMFSGMPDYQIGGHRMLHQKLLRPLFFIAYFGNHNAAFHLFFYLLAFYLLLRTYEIDKLTSLAGALAMAFSSYFIIIIGASHNSKVIAITWMMMIFIGFLLIFRQRYLWGAFLIMLFTPLALYQHPQMAYYILMMVGLLYIAYLYDFIRDKRYKELLKSSGCFLVAMLVGMAIGGPNLLANREYTKETMRGGHSDLVKEETADTKVDKGLNLDYATQWSYGVTETLTLYIPNAKGGASGMNVGTKSVLYKEMRELGVPEKTARQFCEQAPVYWGDQPFTVGPVYVGAIIYLLFWLGLFIVPGSKKWALLIATLFSIALSLGHNMMWLTEFFFRYFPMYSKFRAVSSILIVAEIAMPLLGFLAVRQLYIDRNDEKKNKYNTTMLIASIIFTGLLCLVFALFGGSMFDFTSPNDAAFKSQLPKEIYDAIINQRISMLKSDALRSLMFIILSGCVLLAFLKTKMQPWLVSCLLAVLVGCDMIPVAKRYCPDSLFVTQQQMNQTFKMQPYEKQILQDDGYFRVMNLTVNTFNDARTSYYLRSVGGYSAAKLRRYQDLIDEHLSKMNLEVLNMLNTKYIIQRGENGKPVVRLNPYAFGPAWFVDELHYAQTANEENEGLNTLDLQSIAIADKCFEHIGKLPPQDRDTDATITLLSHTPKQLVYKTNSTTEQLAVFSEIYYPYGWKASIDGKPVEHFRADYTLRALNIPAGEHEITFLFDPDSLKKGNILCIIGFILMIITFLIAVYKTVIRKAKQ
ncbi:MAG: YfhO family protein [Paludibacteraceae bacterium]|nr:YfhO family protein [Paludibacteraceae bacterium]